MPRFPSPEWIDAVASRLAAHPKGPRAAARLDGVYRFVIEPAGPLHERHRYDIEVRPGPHGDAVVRRVEGTPDVTVRGPYDAWRAVLTGEHDPRLAVLRRQLRVEGSKRFLLGRLSSGGAMLEAVRSVDTAWLD